jgi:perosamine synthetase
LQQNAVNPVRYVGAEPIFIDCDDTLNMDMDKLEEFLENECNFTDGKVINKKTNRQVKAIVVVHVFGNPANMEKLMEVKEKYKLKIIEDATEALGSYYLEGKFAGKHCGTIGDIGVYSFNANKIITTGGGGMVVSNNQELLDKVAFLGVQAKTDSLYFVHDEIGYNYRMTNIQAAFGTDQIDRLEGFIKTKMRNYNLYKKAIEDINGLTLLPFRTDTRPLWRLIHKQKPYLNSQSYRIEKAEYYEKNLLNIPCSSNLSEDDVMIVVEKLRKYKK